MQKKIIKTVGQIFSSYVLIVFFGISAAVQDDSQSFKEVWAMKHMLSSVEGKSGSLEPILISPELGLIVSSNGELEEWITKKEDGKKPYEKARQDLAKLFFRYQDNEVQCSNIPDNPLKWVTAAVLAEWVKKIRDEGINQFVVEIGLLNTSHEKQTSVADLTEKSKKRPNDRLTKEIENVQKDLIRVNSDVQKSTLFQQWDIYKNAETEEARKKIQIKYKQYSTYLEKLVKIDPVRAQKDFLRILMGHLYLKAVELSVTNPAYQLASYFRSMGIDFVSAYYTKKDQITIQEKFENGILEETVSDTEDLVFLLKFFILDTFFFLKMPANTIVDYAGDLNVPICAESVVRSFVQVVLYNSLTGKLDLDLLSDTVNLKPEFKAFIEKYSDYITTDWYGSDALKDWMDLVSCIDGVIYLRSAGLLKYELLADSNNILKVLNNLFGVQAIDFQNLAEILSGTQAHRINVESIVPGPLDRQISIRFIVMMTNGISLLVGMNIKPGHGEFLFFDKGFSEFFSLNYINKIETMGIKCGQSFLGIVFNKKTLNVKKDSGLLPLDSFIDSESIDLINSALFYGADITMANSMGQTPLVNLVKKWISYERLSLDQKTFNTFIITTIENLPKLTDVIPEKREQVARSYDSALIEAIYLNNERLTSLLLEKGANILSNSYGEMVVVQFIRAHKTKWKSDMFQKIFTSLPSSSDDPDLYRQMMNIAVTCNNESVANLLFSKATSLFMEESSEYILMNLINSPENVWKQQIMQKILQQLPAVEITTDTTDFYRTLLNYAIMYDNEEVANTLLSKGFNGLISSNGEKLLVSLTQHQSNQWQRDVLEKVVQFLPDMPKTSDQALVYGLAMIQALRNGQIEIAKKLFLKVEASTADQMSISQPLVLCISEWSLTPSTQLNYQMNDLISNIIHSLPSASGNDDLSKAYGLGIINAIQKGALPLAIELLDKGANLLVNVGTFFNQESVLSYIFKHKEFDSLTDPAEWEHFKKNVLDRLPVLDPSESESIDILCNFLIEALKSFDFIIVQELLKKLSPESMKTQTGGTFIRELVKKLRVFSYDNETQKALHDWMISYLRTLPKVDHSESPLGDAYGVALMHALNDLKDLALAEDLLKKGANILYQEWGEYSETPLSYLIRFCSKIPTDYVGREDEWNQKISQLIDELFENFVDKEIVDSSNRVYEKALMYAINENNLFLMHKLLEKEIDFFWSSGYGQTHFKTIIERWHSSVINGDTDSVYQYNRILLEIVDKLPSIEAMSDSQKQSLENYFSESVQRNNISVALAFLKKYPEFTEEFTKLIYWDIPVLQETQKKLSEEESSTEYKKELDEFLKYVAP